MGRHRPILVLPVLLTGIGLIAGFAPSVAGARILPNLSARIPTPEAIRPAGMPTDEELERSGARIGEIRLESRRIFDVAVDDEDTTLTRLANRWHVQTRPETIRDLLLFKSGDPYRARVLEESARILRDTRFLRDARVRPVAFHDGVVDIEVIAQDVWTLNPGFAYGRKGGSNTSGFEVEDLNFLGTGTHLSLELTSSVDRDSREIYYRDRQLGSSWWDMTASYADNSDGRLAEFSLEHPFYSLGTRWAGGMSWLDDRRTDSRYDLGEIVDRFAVAERRFSLHVGSSRGLVDDWARRVIVGFTFDEHQFDVLSGPGAATPLPLRDRKLSYPWVAVEWLQDDFHIDRNRDQIERIEDQALGWRLRGTVGYASTTFGSDRDAMILGATFSKGLALSGRQSLEFSGDASGRVEGSSVAAGLLDASVRYYFRQSPRRLFFMNLSGQMGLRLDPDQQILLGGDSGLRGYPLRYQSGTRRWLFTAEQRLFSDWYPFQLFNVGGAVFYDMGRTLGRDASGTASQGLLRDVGFGLRLGNSRSSIGSVLHVDVAFPLDGGQSIRNAQLLIETRKSF